MKEIAQKQGSLGFDYDLNKSQKGGDRNKAINDDIPRAKKRQRICINDNANKDKNTNSNSNTNSHSNRNKNRKPQKPQPPSSKATAKSISSQTLSQTWRWSANRRKVAVEQAVKHRLFDIKITGGRRDSKMNVIVSEMNNMTDIDINFVLLTVENYKKEIYKIQRKVIKIPTDQVALLPNEEQQLREQLKQSGDIEEANKSRMSANSS